MIMKCRENVNLVKNLTMISLRILKQLLKEEKNKKKFRKGVYKKVIFGILKYTQQTNRKVKNYET